MIPFLSSSDSGLCIVTIRLGLSMRNGVCKALGMVFVEGSEKDRIQGKPADRASVGSLSDGVSTLAR